MLTEKKFRKMSDTQSQITKHTKKNNIKEHFKEQILAPDSER